MATVLVVDDRATNRELIVTLLHHQGHRPLEAADGAEGLALVRSERPDLVISDILMPTMDGYEFVRQLRADPALAPTNVMFYTAHYHEREARNLAKSCGVSHVLLKPSEPDEILHAIDQALARQPQAALAPIEQDFDRQHMRVMTDKLSENASQLRAANQRLAALTDVNLQLASETNPRVLLESVCRDARNLVGAKFAVLCVRDKNKGQTDFCATSGIDAADKLVPPQIDGGIFERVLAGRNAHRYVSAAGEPTTLGLPAGYPTVHSALAAPIASMTVGYGWICLLNKLGADEFDEDDERILVSLASLVGRIYETGSLYAELQRHTDQLKVEIAERKRSAELLRESELRFRQLAESIHEVFFLVGPSFTPILYVSPAYEEIWDRTCESLYASPLSWTDSIHPDDRERALQSTTSKGGFDVEYRIVRPSGGLRWIRARGFPIRDKDGQVYRTAGIAEDVTERVDLERVLRESEAAMRHGDTIAKLAHIITRPDGSFQSWSDTLPQLIGMEPARVPSTTRAWLNIVHPDDRDKFRVTAIAAGASGTRTEIEYRIVRGDGEHIHVRQVYDPIHDSANEQGKHRWFNTLQDITNQKRSEEEVGRLNANLEHLVAERTAELQIANRELEAFSYSVSHDLRAPLHAIQGYAEALNESPTAQLGDKDRHYLERIGSGSASMDQLIDDLLSLSRISRADLVATQVDLSALAMEVLADVRPADPSRRSEITVRPGMRAHGDAGLLRIALTNLLGNAWKFSGGREVTVIEVGQLENAGSMTTFFVRDNGAGFDPAYSVKLFGTFQRLHSQAEFPGTGIGLATVQRVIERHGGTVRAEGAVNQGATFYFSLPGRERPSNQGAP